MSDKRPYISVIIPVYNGEKFLPGCLDALVSGSYRDYELIVVDDYSTDRSVFSFLCANIWIQGGHEVVSRIVSEWIQSRPNSEVP